ncbi:MULTISPECIES: MFS transporter [Amycolatopsis]|uniref:MFS-type transporter involved in bile tolerance, Atg22 family n=1 Tax=Amycolatopsis sacchari TaxID=115433 RepID=A0A1I3QIZ2_9PSEU|nr:MFS transporter [Amycolatopsis sacchari]SFJ33251.1 MFS-type transporter involved in bile tolerance, Atg22 family [Amycolatopsis sacchari]
MTSSARTRAIASNLVGTVLEWYDFYIYGTATSLAFGSLFFPSSSALAGTLAAFATYAIGFVLRPVAGVVLARWGDTLGRKNVMVLCLVLMGAATGGIGLLPTYAQVGALAPVLLVLLRLVQSIGAGAEYGTAITMSAEHSTARRRGLLSSMPALGVSLGILLGTGVFASLSGLPKAEFLAWGWRVPFLVGFALVLVGLYIRLRVDESPEFTELKSAGAIVRNPIRELLRTHRRHVVLAALARATDAVGSQVFNVFAISYCTGTLGMSSGPALTGVMAANLTGLAVIPLAGRCADRWGRKPVFLTGLLFVAVAGFPFFWLLQTREPVLVVLALVLVYGIGIKIALSVSGAYLAEMFDPRVRNSGVNLARSASDPLAGFTPLIATALLALAGSYWAVGVFVVGTALVSAGAVLAGPETRQPHPAGERRGGMAEQARS